MKVRVLDVQKDSVSCVIYDGKNYGEVKEYVTFTENIRSQRLRGVV